MTVLTQYHLSNGLWWVTTSKVLFALILSLILSFCFPSSTETISSLKSFHNPSISPTAKISLQHKELGWQTRSKKTGYFKSLNIYPLAGLILLFLIFILVKKRTKPK